MWTSQSSIPAAPVEADFTSTNVNVPTSVFDVDISCVLRLECWMCWMDWLDVLSWRLQLQLLAASRSSALRKLEYSGVSAAAGAQQSGSVCTEKINISGG